MLQLVAHRRPQPSVIALFTFLSLLEVPIMLSLDLGVVGLVSGDTGDQKMALLNTCNYGWSVHEFSPGRSDSLNVKLARKPLDADEAPLK